MGNNTFFVVKTLETVQRTIEVDFEISIPNEILKNMSEDDLNDYLTEKIETNEGNSRFGEIVESQQLDLEILSIEKNKKFTEISKNNYTIYT